MQLFPYVCLLLLGLIAKAVPIPDCAAGDQSNLSSHGWADPLYSSGCKLITWSETAHNNSKLEIYADATHGHQRERYYPNHDDNIMPSKRSLGQWWPVRSLGKWIEEQLQANHGSKAAPTPACGSGGWRTLERRRGPSTKSLWAGNSKEEFETWEKSRSNHTKSTARKDAHHQHHHIDQDDKNLKRSLFRWWR